MKVCNRCGYERDESEFHRNAPSPDGLLGVCKPCRAEQHRQRTYGLEVGEFDRMLTEQGGGCAMCGQTPRRFYVDHNHDTGRVRGLLCNYCNSGLRNEEFHVAALAYLEEFDEASGN